MPRSPKGSAAARGLDAHLRLQHAFMPAGDASLKTAQVIKMLVDSNHGIYRDHCRFPIRPFRSDSWTSYDAAFLGLWKACRKRRRGAISGRRALDRRHLAA
jgi:hypothetical protein